MWRVDTALHSLQSSKELGMEILFILSKSSADGVVIPHFKQQLFVELVNRLR